MRYNSKLDKHFKIIFFILIVIGLGVSTIRNLLLKDEFSITPFIISVVSLGFIYYSSKTTYYIIEGNELICKSLFLKRKIEINCIRKIEKSNSLGSIYKIASAFHGLTIHYNKFDDVFISPENYLEFCKLLKEQNPSIQFIPETEFNLNS
ncbi:MAG: hypothetical protein RIT10_800 [Bacteroidota bacterium]|jgi:hypothetical protein